MTRIQQRRKSDKKASAFVDYRRVRNVLGTGYSSLDTGNIVADEFCRDLQALFSASTRFRIFLSS
jgi:hypothetical protein